MKSPTKKNLPRSVQQLVWLSLGSGPTRQCRLVEISDAGAKLRLTDDGPMPQIFYMLFSPQALSRRKCELVSHENADVELRFLGKEVAGPQEMDRALQWNAVQVAEEDDDINTAVVES